MELSVCRSGLVTPDAGVRVTPRRTLHSWRLGCVVHSTKHPTSMKWKSCMLGTVKNRTRSTASPHAKVDISCCHSMSAWSVCRTVVPSFSLYWDTAQFTDMTESVGNISIFVVTSAKWISTTTQCLLSLHDMWTVIVQLYLFLCLSVPVCLSVCVCLCEFLCCVWSCLCVFVCLWVCACCDVTSWSCMI